MLKFCIFVGILSCARAGVYIPMEEPKENNCTDFEGNTITHGGLYVPGPNVCSSCVCYYGDPMWCKTIFCLGPPKCKNLVIGVYCCDFTCLDANPPEKKPRRRKFSFGSSAARILRPYIPPLWTLLFTLYLFNL